MKNSLWHFTDDKGSFESFFAHKIKTLYFPLANEGLLSSITPDLHGDIKTGQDSFLLLPVSRQDLSDQNSSRNFWLYIDKDNIWSASGVSKNAQQIAQDKAKLEAGLLWHRVTRENKKIGLRAEILSFVAQQLPVEAMRVSIVNISRRRIHFTPIAAIPIYGRSADNLRDHRHVSSLLQRVKLHKYGVLAKPALVFDEKGHCSNNDIYFVLGWGENFSPPQYICPTQEIFCGEAGDLAAPESVFSNIPAQPGQLQGREAIGALRFKRISLAPGECKEYVILLGITRKKNELEKIIRAFNKPEKLDKEFEQTKNFWVSCSRNISFTTGDSDFDNWLRWVNIQPYLRKIYGCSFLPDFDYGKGGRGWRDLWQDCLGLILNDPARVRGILINNFSGVRIDGSNATLIGKENGEFISDRNNISRVWMDHGVWPLLTLDLYLNETGDYNILSEQATYFRNHETCRVRETDSGWNADYGNNLRTVSGKIYKGSIFEHLLVENLVQFFNVGSHNHIRLEDADWNDGLDMAREKGESVAFSAMYAHNLSLLSELLLKIKKDVSIAKELKILLQKTDYGDPKEKNKILTAYFNATNLTLSGKKLSFKNAELAENLREKSEWIFKNIREKEWLGQGFFNGYYDNDCQGVEGIKEGTLRLILTSQVFPVISGAADKWQVKKIINSVNKYLYDRKIKGFRLNTDFKREMHSLGRAFSFVYGDKENGAVFNHMVVIYANALYKRKFNQQGWRVLSSIYHMAMNSSVSKIYPCLPEYFNLQGRGMYAYLTGSASWYMLTLLTEAFGVKGKDGDLLLEPKLSSEQFRHKPLISVERNFSGRRLKVNFLRLKRRKTEQYKIIKASLNKAEILSEPASSLIIKRKRILSLPKNKLNILEVALS